MSYDDLRDIFNIRLLKGIDLSGKYDLPKISANTHIQSIENIQSFNYYKSISKKSDYYIHFYLDDYQFERIWKSPRRYISILKEFKGVIGPDFSVYTNMPKAQQIFQVYKQRLFMALLQKEGVNMIPNVTWSDIDSLDWILEDYPKNSVIALSSNGCLNKQVRSDFIECFKKAVEKLQPIQIIVIGEVPDELKQNNVIEIKNHINTLRKIKRRSNI